MTDLVIHEPLASSIRQLAERERVSPEVLVEQLIQTHPSNGTAAQPDLTSPLYTPTPEQLREMPIEEAEKHIRRKIFRIARRYWLKHRDTEKASLTDEQLELDFWLIDHEGIPRFNWEKDTVKLPPDPMDALIGLFDDSDITDASITMAETRARYYGVRNKRPD